MSGNDRRVVQIVEDDKGMDGRFSRPPGALGRMVAVGHAMGHRDNRWAPLAGGIVALSVATRNRWVVDFYGGYSRLNLYVLDVEPSGAGKETGRRLLQLATREAEVGYAETIVSDAALHEALVHSPQIALSIDEFGRYISEARADKGGHRTQAVTKLMSVYGLAGSYLAERTYAKARDTKARIDKPFVSALLSTTPVRLKEGLESADVIDGTLNRMLVIQNPALPKFKDPEATSLPDDKLPDDVRDMLRRMRAGPALPEGHAEKAEMENLIDVEPGRVVMDDVLQRRHFKFRDEMDERAEGPIGPMWVRAAEQTLRVAGVLTVADAALAGPLPRVLHMRPEVYQWAQDFVVACIEAVQRDIAEELAANPREVIQKRIMQVIRDAVENPRYKAPAKGYGWVKRTAIIDKTKTNGRNRRDVEDELATLIEAGLIESEEGPREAGKGGPPARYLRIIGGGENRGA